MLGVPSGASGRRRNNARFTRHSEAKNMKKRRHVEKIMSREQESAMQESGIQHGPRWPGCVHGITMLNIRGQSSLGQSDQSQLAMKSRGAVSFARGPKHRVSGPGAAITGCSSSRLLQRRNSIGLLISSSERRGHRARLCALQVGENVATAFAGNTTRERASGDVQRPAQEEPGTPYGITLHETYFTVRRVAQ
jgi:hypothetical protein